MTPAAVALIAVVLALAGCGGDDSGNGGGSGYGGATTEPEAENRDEAATTPGGEPVRSAKVEIADFAYDPDPVTVAEGGKVIWINRDAEPHTATAEDDSFDTGPLKEGKLKSESFKQPGEYAYFCEIHPEMRGTVEVVANE